MSYPAGSWAERMAYHRDAFLSELHDDPEDPCFPDAEWARWCEEKLRFLFDTFASGDADEAEVIVEGLDQALMRLNQNVHKHLDRAKSDTVDWQGDTAEDFRHRLDDMNDAITRMHDCLDGTKRAMTGYRELQRKFRDGVLGFIESSHDQLDAVEQAQHEEAHKKRLNMISSVINIVGAADDEDPVGVVTAMVQGEISDKILDVSGPTKEEVFNSMVDEGNKILDDAVDSRYRIDRGLYTVLTYLTDIDKKKTGGVDQVRPKRPKLITDDSFDPDEFSPKGQSPKEHGKVDRDDLVADPGPDRDDREDHHVDVPGQPQPHMPEIPPGGSGFLIPEERPNYEPLPTPERGADIYPEQ
ncbi:hypothetical protein [Sciscionella marina]|uniref:hypothetical protein n=1 Tax=Sciscionella marina TaxID=508770 RepID=UPI000375E402|nr:hypothetical protein [Sciscionella marina]